MSGKVRVGRALSLVGVNVLVLIALLCLAEAALRVLGIPYAGDYVPTEDAIARFDKDLGWAYIPGLSKEIPFGTRIRTVHFDDEGIRVSAADTRLFKTRPSVLFVGCSVTMGHGLSYEESFVGQFGLLAGDSWQVVNLGVQGYGTDQSLLALKKFAPGFNTKVVVYTFIGDHNYRNGSYDRRRLIPSIKVVGTKPQFALDPAGVPYLAKKPLPLADYRISYLRELVTMRWEDRIGSGPAYPVNLTLALIREMATYCRERNIRFVVVNWRWSDAEVDWLRDLGVDVIDTLKDAPAGWENMTIPGDTHPDVSAGTYVARILYDYFRDRSLL